MPLRPISDDDKLTLLFYLLNRQTGAIADCPRHIQGDKQSAGYSNDETKAWITYAQTELADILAIVRKFCTVLGIDYDATVVMGFVRDLEKGKEYSKRHLGAVWI